MTTRRALGFLCALSILLGIGVAHAQNVVLKAEAFTAPVSVVKELGYDWMFLPRQKSRDPATASGLNFDSARPLRGSLSPDQRGTVDRALAGANIPLVTIGQATIAPGGQTYLPSPDGQKANYLSITLQSVAAEKIMLRTSGSSATVTQPVALSPGGTVTFSFPGPTPDTITVYLVTAGAH